MFKVTFPDSLPAAKLDAIKGALPGPSKGADDADMDAEECMLSAFEESQRNTKAGGGTRDDSEDEDEDSGHPGGGQRVQCAQQ